jgi:hypothetical protein
MMRIGGTKIVSRGSGVGDGGIVICGWGRYEYSVYLLFFNVIRFPYVSRFVLAFGGAALDVSASGVVIVVLELGFAVLAAVAMDNTISMGPAVSIGIEAGFPGGAIERGAARTVVYFWCRGRCCDGVAKFVDQGGVGGKGTLELVS